jgi:hypothetical protein
MLNKLEQFNCELIVDAQQVGAVQSIPLIQGLRTVQRSAVPRHSRHVGPTDPHPPVRTRRRRRTAAAQRLHQVTGTAHRERQVPAAQLAGTDRFVRAAIA